MNNTEEIERLKTRVDALENRSDERSRIEAEILEYARQWARLTKLGFYIDAKGFRVTLSITEAKDLADSYMLFIQNKSAALLRLNA